MSEKPANTPNSPGMRLLRSLWDIYQLFALLVGSAVLACAGITLVIFASEPDARAGIDQAFRIPSRHLAPADFHTGSHHTLSVQIGSGYDEAAFVADLIQSGWQKREDEQRAWRSFDRAGMTLRLFPNGLFALPTCLDSPDAAAPTDTRTFLP